MMFHISYDFYKEFDNKILNKQLEIRINDIKIRYFNKNDNKNIIEEYFVELFSWSVFSKSILDKFNIIFNNYAINSVIDPCCGNGFHTFLIKTYLDLDIISIDIQDEPNSWISIYEIDGRTYLNLFKKEEFKIKLFYFHGLIMKV